MIDIVITSYNEPKATLRAVNAFLNQNIKEKFKITVVDPFPEVKKFLKQNIRDKNISFFLDPGEGKSYALNILFSELYSQDKNDIFILTDGDVYVSENSVSEIIKAFRDQKVGCVAAKPVPIDPRNTKYGYWAHILFYLGADKIRSKLSKQDNFFECSGYLFAIRKGLINEFPLDTSEDSIIPYLIYKQGYKIAYVPSAEVYVKNPDNFKDWVNQRIRNIKAHENLNKIAPDLPRTKSFKNEIKEGLFTVLMAPRNIKEFLWTIELIFARLYIYLKSFSESNKKYYKDGWRETEIKSTKPLD